MKKTLLISLLLLIGILLCACFAGRGGEVVTTASDGSVTHAASGAPKTGLTTHESKPVSAEQTGEKPQTSTAATGLDTASSVITSGVSTASGTEEVTTAATEAVTETEAPEVFTPFTLAFVGDVNYADNNVTLKNAVRKGYTVEDCYGESILTKMRAADLFIINNEFCFSDRGSALSGKAYTFRAATKNVEYLHQIGADIACLANNHVFDFGDDAFLDTLDTLSAAGIPYIGAGHDEEEAYSAYYTEISGVKIAVLAASRAEASYLSKRVASGDKFGIAGIFDSSRFVQAIKEAREKVDYVIAFVHWGTEYSEKLQSAQTTMGRQFIDAGADIVIGAHPHILQGVEYYGGKPIIYSLGTYWHNMRALDTALLRIVFNEDGYELYLDAARQENGITKEITDAEKRDEFYRHMSDMSKGVIFESDGRISEKK